MSVLAAKVILTPLLISAGIYTSIFLVCLDLATRWLPAPHVLHPYPDARFAATHPR